jgi:hypothetical protein
MFVVTLVLSQLISWMRAQSGCQSLRAILYMDEIFGYFPPTANPPSKTPMLTLLKQARAYGIGCVLSTQNPVDLDYKGLSNCGTWLLGRLQTERDKARVIEGLASASSGIEGRLDRETLDRTLSGLGSRTFLLNNVHEDQPLLMRSRWVLSSLAGPLSRLQIKKLVPDARSHEASKSETTLGSVGTGSDSKRIAESQAEVTRGRPLVPVEAAERFLPVTHGISGTDRIVYRPVLLGQVSTHYANVRSGVDEWSQRILWAPIEADLEGSPWEGARLLTGRPDLEHEPEAAATFAPLPGLAERKKSWGRWAKQLEATVYREHPLLLWKSKKPKLVSRPGEDEGAFRGRVSDAFREARDLELEKLRKRYAPKVARLQERIDRSLERVDREEEQYKDSKTQTLLSFGATMVGALFGRKLASAGNVRRTASAMKGVSRTARQKSDIGRAEARVEEYQQDLADLEIEFQEALHAVEDRAVENEVEIEALRINAKKADLEVERLSLVWVPSRVGSDGEVQFIGSLDF